METSAPKDEITEDEGNERLLNCIHVMLVVKDVIVIAAWVIYAVVFVALLFPDGHKVWLPCLRMNFWLDNIGTCLFFPTGFILVFFPKLRHISGAFLLFCKSFVSIGLTCFCAVLTVDGFGKGGLIIGTLLAGYGIVLTGLIDVLMQHKHLFCAEIIVLAIVVWNAWIGGDALIRSRLASANTRLGSANRDKATNQLWVGIMSFFTIIIALGFAVAYGYVHHAEVKATMGRFQ